MRSTLLFFIIMAVLIFIGCESEQPKEQNDWYSYGNSFTIEKSIPLSEAVLELEQYEETPVLVEGTISAVCQSRGCWMLVKDKDAMVRVRFVDYSFFVPWESKGKMVRIEGTMKKEIVSEEVARHWAEEAKEPEFYPEKIHGDQELIVITASAVAIQGGTEISPEQQAVISGDEDIEHTH